MSRKLKNKISTDHDNSLSVANPFAGVNLNNLPEVPGLKLTQTISKGTKIKSKGRVDVVREKSGRAGKTVTVLREFSETISSEELDTIAFKLKKHCACGGSVKNRTIELQGDVCKPVMLELEQLRFRPVRCGG